VNEPTRGFRWALALAATLTMAVSYVDRQTLAVLAPTVTAALGISDQNYGWLAAAFSIAYLAGAPIAGRIIDLVGARRGLLGAVLLWSLVAALHALAPGFGILFALRIALGLAEAPSFPGASQTVYRSLPPEERARGFGVLFTGSSFGAMIAPPLATAIAALFGWRFAFVGVAIVGLAWVPVWVGLAFSRRGRALLDAPATTTTRIGWREWLRLWGHPAVLRGVAVVLATSPMLAFAFLWSAKFLAHEYRLTQTEIGAVLWIPPVVFDVGAVIFGHLVSRRAARLRDGSPPRAIFAAAMLLCMAIAVMPRAPDALTAVLIGGLAMAGGGAAFAILTADMLSRVPPALVSSAGGITAAAQSLAYIVASPLIGASVERHASYAPILLQLGLWVLPGCLLWLFWRPPPMVQSS
jgi:ACS family hexuronate transporter-like MFS transporter